jgi:hypothetical protein
VGVVLQELWKQQEIFSMENNNSRLLIDTFLWYWMMFFFSIFIIQSIVNKLYFHCLRKHKDVFKKLGTGAELGYFQVSKEVRDRSRQFLINREYQKLDDHKLTALGNFLLLIDPLSTFTIIVFLILIAVHFFLK